MGGINNHTLGLLLIAKDQMKYATAEEAAPATVIAKDANLTAEQPQDKKAYVDLTHPQSHQRAR